MGGIYGSNYYQIVYGPTWDEAQSNAVSIGGNLVSINDSDENNFLIKKLKDHSANRYFIGLKKTNSNWGWISGESLSFTNWGPSEPSGDNGNGNWAEMCLEAEVDAQSDHWTFTAGQWNDISALTESTNHGIAEIPLSYFSISDLTITEGETGTVTINRTGGISTAQTLNLSSSDLSANAGIDYVAINQTISFAANETSKSISISSIEDKSIESDETFLLTLTASDSDNIPAQISNGFSTITIENDDSDNFSVTDLTGSVSISGDDGYELYLNGTLIGSDDNSWWTSESWDLKFNEGINSIAIKGINSPGGHPGAAIADFNIGSHSLVTDSSWFISTEVQNGWNTNPVSEQNGYSSAIEYGDVNSTTWFNSPSYPSDTLENSNFPTNSLAKWIWSEGLKTDSIVYIRKDIYIDYKDTADEIKVADVNSSYVADSNGFSSVNGSAPVIITAYTIGQETNLDSIKDYDGNLHAGDYLTATASSYKYQGLLDVNGDGVFEAIFTNKSSKRWVTAEVDSATGKIDFDDHGAGGTTRVVGIYIDPLVTTGEVEQYGPYDSQRRFQNDLKIDNLVAKHSGDYDSDGIHEVYWKTADGSAYLRSLMHADGNIRYANYQSEDQMSNYLTDNGYESVISNIT